MSVPKAFEREMIKAFKVQFPTAYVERNPDKQYQKSPPDMLACTPTANYLIEAKTRLCKGRNKPWYVKHLREHQVEHLELWQNIADHYHAYVALLYYNQLRGKQRMRRAWLIPFDYVTGFENKHGRKSIHLHHLENDIPHLEMTWENRIWKLPEEICNH